MEDRIFDISFDFDQQHYSGWANPSDKTDANGKPASFHVVLDGVSFGHLSFNNCNWATTEERPAALVEAVGKAIEHHFTL
jgi:hypothetical protein